MGMLIFKMLVETILICHHLDRVGLQELDAALAKWGGANFPQWPLKVMQLQGSISFFTEQFFLYGIFMNDGGQLGCDPSWILEILCLLSMTGIDNRQGENHSSILIPGMM